VIGSVTALLIGGCGSGTVSGRPPASPSPSAPSSTRDRAHVDSSKAAGELAGRAAASKDHHYRATYRYDRGRGKAVDVTVAVAADGAWQVEVPGGARGGKVDVTIAHDRNGYFQCATVKRRTCVAVTGSAGKLPASIDPVVEHVFTDWMDHLLNRRVPVSVTYADRLPGADAKSRCYWLETNSVTVSSPVPPGTYCLRPDGLITAAKSDFGTLRLDGEPEPGPSTLKLPGDVADSDPLPTKAPPKPKPKPSKSPTAKPTKRKP
jgi:hypothetical protein